MDVSECRKKPYIEIFDSPKASLPPIHEATATIYPMDFPKGFIDHACQPDES